MAKASGYKDLEGTVKNGVYVHEYYREQKITKTGNTYSQGRLIVAYETSKDITLNISIGNWNRWDFIKKLDELNGIKTSSEKQTKTRTKTTKTKTKAQEKLEQVYNSWYENYSKFYQRNFKNQIYWYVKDLLNENQEINEQVISKFLDFWGRWFLNTPAGDYTCKSKSANDRRRMQNKANEDAWENGKWNERINEVIQEAITRIKQEKEEQERLDKEYKRRRFEKRMRDTYGENWQEAWERENFGEGFNTKIDANEFTVEFKGCKTIKEVKAVYRKLSKQWHPDMGGDTAKMAKVNDAYETAIKKVA